MNIHHIGVVVKNINNSILLYSNMGYSFHQSIVFDYFQNNQIALMRSVFSPTIELIEPINERSTVYKFKEGYHHICYEAEAGEDIVKKFKMMGIGKIFMKPINAPAFNNRSVVFAYLKNNTLVEFIL